MPVPSRSRCKNPRKRGPRQHRRHHHRAQPVAEHTAGLVQLAIGHGIVEQQRPPFAADQLQRRAGDRHHRRPAVAAQRPDATGAVVGQHEGPVGRERRHHRAQQRAGDLLAAGRRRQPAGQFPQARQRFPRQRVRCRLAAAAGADHARLALGRREASGGLPVARRQHVQVGIQHEQRIAHGDLVPGRQRRARLDALAVDEGAVLAAQVLDGDVVGRHHEAAVLARGLGVGQLHVRAGGPPHHQVCLQRQAQSLLGSEQRQQRRHRWIVSRRGGRHPERRHQRHRRQQIHVGGLRPVVDHPGQPQRVAPIAGDAHVVGVRHRRQRVQEQHVARLQVGQRHPLPVPGEVADQVLHAPVIDAGVAPPADARVGPGRTAGVVVNRLLQVDAGVPQGANHHVAAHALLAGHVAPRVAQPGGGFPVAGPVERDLLRPQQDVDGVGDAVAVHVATARPPAQDPPAADAPAGGLDLGPGVELGVDAAVRGGTDRGLEQPEHDGDGGHPRGHRKRGARGPPRRAPGAPPPLGPGGAGGRAIRQAALHRSAAFALRQRVDSL